MDFTNKESQLESIREIFAEATQEDGWDMSQEMLYSYFFVDKDVEKLKNFADKLQDDFDARKSTGCSTVGAKWRAAGSSPENRIVD